LIHYHLAGPPVVADKAVFARGIDPVTVREPEPSPPLIEAGSAVDRVPPFDIVERDLIGIQQYALQSCHAGITLPVRRYFSAHQGDFAVGEFGRNPSASSHINSNKN
jgi:hypothetical protein